MYDTGRTSNQTRNEMYRAFPAIEPNHRRSNVGKKFRQAKLNSFEWCVTSRARFFPKCRSLNNFSVLFSAFTITFIYIYRSMRLFIPCKKKVFGTKVKTEETGDRFHTQPLSEEKYASVSLKECK